MVSIRRAFVVLSAILVTTALALADGTAADEGREQVRRLFGSEDGAVRLEIVEDLLVSGASTEELATWVADGVACSADAPNSVLACRQHCVGRRPRLGPGCAGPGSRKL